MTARHPTSGDPAPPGATGTAIQLSVSAEAAEMFTSLATQSVPILCDNVVIEITGISTVRRIAYPPSTGTRHLVTAGTGTGHSVRHSFTSRQWCVDEADPVIDGVVVFGWDDRLPTLPEQLLAGALVEQVTRTLAWQHSAQRAQTSAQRADHLDTALRNSRRIGAAVGILMATCRITEPAAFELLRMASQHSHRKVREVAQDVIETGWLDPALAHGKAAHSEIPLC